MDMVTAGSIKRDLVTTESAPPRTGADEAASTDGSTHRPSRWSNAVPALVLAASLAATAGTWAVTARVVTDQEDRLLAERADEVRAFLSNSLVGIVPSLRVLSAAGTSLDPAAAGLFNESASPLLVRGTVAVGAAVKDGEGFKVTNAVGSGPPPGQALDPVRARLAQRAMGGNQVATALLPERGGKRLVMATAATNGRGVAYMETFLPSTPIPSSPDSPFRELRAAVYTSDDPDPAQLLLTTEAELPLEGRVRNVSVEVGADRWLLSVAAREPLTGAFAATVPRLFLGGGVVLSFVAAAVARLLVRRRQFALDLVAKRTGELQTTLAELDGTRAALDRMLTAGPMLVIRADAGRRSATYVSPNAERVWGVSRAETTEPGFLFDRVHADDRDRFGASLRLVAEGAAAQQSVEYRFRRGDGSYRWTAGVLVPAGTAAESRNGAPSDVLVYALDVDDRRRADQQRQEAQAAAEAANLAKSEFLSRMSHELRTPLNAVLGFGQLLQLQPLTDEQQEFVDYIVKGGRHLLDLINEVLDISRIEAGELALSPEAVLASGLVHDAVELIRPLAEQQGIQLIVDRSGAWDCYVFADAQRAKQILLNLLSNAVKYNRIGGTVAVSCSTRSATRATISVTDTGPGIPSEQLDRLFTAFDRLGAEHTDVEGTGIGLALSKRLAEVMDGTLSVTSVLGKGSTFAVELPVVEGPVERYQRLGPAEAPARPAAPTRRKVLHIEDNLANLNLMERILGQRGDVEVVAAMQGSLGLELAREHRPALVLLDLHLPDMSGERVLQRLRDDPETSSIPVVMVSADATTGQVQRLLAAGASAYITKPVDVSALLRVLDDAMAGQEH
jgi:signal transduction histidine kinase/CheY-like chemotaxis protein